MSKEIVIDQLREYEKKTNRQIFSYLFFILINMTKDFLIKKKNYFVKSITSEQRLYKVL
jgi:hypothetical protein